MNRIRSLATQTPAIVISLLAVAMSLGGSAYASTHLAAGHSHSPAAHQAAAHQAAAPASGTQAAAAVSWHSLALLNGWASSNGIYGTGNPKVSLAGGIVYLSGSLHQGTPSSSELAILPRAYRPTHNMYITVYTNGDTSGTLYIGANGVMEAYSAGGCGSGNTAQCFTSLATVSYPSSS
jgi:hypothetical protein